MSEAARLAARLVELDAALEALDAAPAVAAEPPGPGVIDDIGAAGLVVPDEVRVWWEWQARPGARALGRSGDRLFTSRWSATGPAGALAEYRLGRSVALKAGRDDAEVERLHPERCLPIARGAGTLVVHCGVDADRAPVDVVDPHGGRPGGRWLFDSMVEMVELVLQAFALGAIRADDAHPGQLAYAAWPMPPEVARRGFW